MEQGERPEPLESIEDIWTPAAHMATVGIFVLLLVVYLYFSRPILVPVVAASIIGTTLAPIVKAGARHRVSPWATAIALGERADKQSVESARPSSVTPPSRGPAPWARDRAQAS